jgi:hypothetical protein
VSKLEVVYSVVGATKTQIGAEQMKKTIRQILESNMPKTPDDMEVQECMEEAMDQYPDLGSMEVDTKDDDEQMPEGYGKMPEEYGMDDEPSTGIKNAFKAAMMKVLDDDTLDTPAKLQKLKMILAVSDKAMEAMGNGQADSGMDSEGMDMGQMEESEKRNVANLCESLTKQVESLKSELENNKCKTLLVESNIEPTSLRIKALLPLSQADRIELAKTWKPGNVATGKRPERTGSVMHESASGAYPADFKEFSRMLG